MKDEIKELYDVIESKDEEIERLNNEISRLVNCVNFYATTGILNDEHDFFILKDLKISVPTTKRAKHLMQIYSTISTKYEK